LASTERKFSPARLLQAAIKVEPNELKATLLSFLFVFLIMTAWFILRPVRDAMSSDWTPAERSWLWTSTFFFSAIAVSIYGAVISRIRFRTIVPGVYGFFALSFLGFFVAKVTLQDDGLVLRLNYGLAAMFGPGADVNDILNRIYYVWASVFGLFHLSVFWTVMSGLYNKEQAKRLFGVITVGATAGGIVGPAFVSLFADDIGNLNMLLISATLLFAPIPIYGWLDHLRSGELGNPDAQADLLRQHHLGANPFSGFVDFVGNPYLLWIGGFIVLYVTMNTFLYMEIGNATEHLEREQRMQVWSRIDLAVNLLAVFTALFATGRLTTKVGMPKTLALVPIIMALGWVAVAISPIAITIYVVQVIRRAGNYAITRPGREILFTVVDNETRFKSKPVIDTVVYRGGDVATAWFYTALGAVFKLSLVGIAIVGAGVAVIWAIVGAYLGGLFEKQSKTETIEHGTE